MKNLIFLLLLIMCGGCTEQSIELESEKPMYETMYDDPKYWALTEEESHFIWHLADMVCTDCDCVEASSIDQESGNGDFWAEMCLIKAAYDLGRMEQIVGAENYKHFVSLLDSKFGFKLRFEQLPKYQPIVTDEEYEIISRLAENSLVVDEFSDTYKEQFPELAAERIEFGHECLTCNLQILKIAYTHTSDLWADTTGEMCEADDFEKMLQTNKELRRLWHNCENSKN